MNKIKNTIDSAIRFMLIILLGGMTINVLWQVFTRFVLQNPSSYTEELARYSLIWTGVLGAAYVAGQKMHLAIDLLPMKLNGKRKIYLELFIQVAVMIFTIFVMIIGGLNLVNMTFTLHQISAALQIPLGFVYLVIPLSGVVILFYCLIFIYEQINLLKKLNSIIAKE